MSTLGDAVRAKLAGQDIETDRIEKVLLDAGVSSMASRGVPVRLRVRRLRVTGTKIYSETPGVEISDAEMKSAPINLDWSPRDGVNGVGSEANLRGKSSVLHLTMWALTGRSNLQADVLSWIDHVFAEFHVDGVPLFVEFDVKDGKPVGTVEQEVWSGRTVLGRFSGHAEFESLMGSVMLDRLRLDVISVFSKGVETEHAWPSYAAALTVNADRLDPIVGNENTLKTRILQMFVGTSWAAVDAQVATALNSLQFERADIVEKRQAVASETAMALEHAENRAANARAKLGEFDPAEPDVNDVLALASKASEHARHAHELSLQLMLARTTLAEVQSQLRAEELHHQAEAEDAVAHRLFNGMSPTVCPRCSTKVTADRYAAEVAEHECSLCTSELHIEEMAVEAPLEPVPTSLSEVIMADEDEEDEGADPLEALREAVAESKAGVEALELAFRNADRSRLDAEAAAQKGRNHLESARARLQAELELARAEGALETLRKTSGPEPSSPAVDEELLILETASKLTKKWVKDDQDPLLESVSATITSLACRFGSTNITAVNLKGNGNMDVHKGGAVTGYSALTNGEKLRIKLAAVIALIELGHRDGVGRHPGLLFVDSPAAEEIPETDLRTMLEAMRSVAEETDLQIFVATTYGPMLSSVLPQENLLVATGADFVW